MKKSELIKILQDEISISGDHTLLEYKIVDAGGGRSGYLYSSIRKNKDGRKSKMNYKEYRDYLLDERSKNQ